VIWVAWRQQRGQILVSVGLVGLVAAALVVVRFAVTSDLAALGLAGCWQTAEGCVGAGLDEVIDRYRPINASYEFVGMVLPALLGLFVGAAMFAREIEQGTHIFSLTQSVSRTRWWTTKALVGGLPVVAAMSGLGLLAGWAREPMAWLVPGRLFTPRFEIEGLTPGAYTLLAVSVGVALGLWLRNTLAAMAVTLALYVAVVAGLATTARAHYAPPVRHVETFTVMPSYPLGDGWLIDEGYLNDDGERVEITFRECWTRLGRNDELIDPQELLETCFREAGAVAYLLVYHPADRYWRFQATEAGIVGALSAGVLGSAALAVRRRLW
jgi:hypothetical protein